MNVGFLLVLSSHFTGRLQVRLRCTPNWFASSRRSAVSSRQRGPPRRRRRRRRRRNDPVGAPPPARASGWGGGPRGRALLRYQLTAPDGPLPFATRRGCSQPPARFAKCAEIPSRRKAAGTTSHCDRDRITHSLIITDATLRPIAALALSLARFRGFRRLRATEHHHATMIPPLFRSAHARAGLRWSFGLVFWSGR